MLEKLAWYSQNIEDQHQLPKMHRELDFCPRLVDIKVEILLFTISSIAGTSIEQESFSGTDTQCNT